MLIIKEKKENRLKNRTKINENKPRALKYIATRTIAKNESTTL